MRTTPLIILSCSLVLLGTACGATVASGGGSPVGGSDSLAGDTQGGTDGAANDTAGKDGAVADTTGKDAEGTDAAGTDAAGGTDATGTDAAGGTDTIDENANGSDAIADLDAADADAIDDAWDIDAAPDVVDTDIAPPDVPDVAPGSCTSDTDCAGLNFAPCQIGYCDTGSKMCKVKAAADGVACSIGGSCGGPGLCSHGGCNAPSTCKPDVCSPQQLMCGTQVKIDLGQLGPSAFGGYGKCDTNVWAGPEAAILMQSDVTMTASLNMDVSGTSVDVQLFDIAPTLDGKCDTAACDMSDFFSLSLGLPANVPRIVIIDTATATTGIVTLTLDCTATVICGDGICDASETCGGCPKDCGKCTGGACGDKTCDATEDCSLCPADCGVCDVGCAAGSGPKCGGCSCEACVCTGPQPNYPNGDAYCCASLWDDNCASECKGCGATCPSIISTCGNGTCDGTEDGTTCPNDCSSSYCGDGVCSVADSEDCTSCSQDCGYCMLGGLTSTGCGDGTCSSDESCTTCTADCGACGDFSCACLSDSTCCTDGFGFGCQDACTTCITANGGGSCPISNCGDGICSGETCKTCSEDCGACPAYCGDGNCDSGETATSCPADCAPGCQGKCGGSSFEADGTFCYCDAVCTQAGDCCSDKATYCP